MIKTKRLILKPVIIDDIDLYKKIMKNPRSTKFLPYGKPYPNDLIKKHVENRVKHWERGFGSYVIYDKENLEKKLGYVGVEISPNPDYRDIRYGLIEEAQGKGYSLEASEAVIEKAFELGIKKVFGVAVKENYASISILKKLNMIPEKEIELYNESNLLTFSISI